MSELLSYQRRFARALAGDPVPLPWATALQFRVYRNTCTKALLDAIRSSYPVTRMIAGGPIFDELGISYAEEHPPKSPVLSHHGDAFPDFLRSRNISDALPYLADVAALERLWLQCSFSADGPELNSDTLAGYRERDLAQFVPSPHPAARLARFNTPAVTIWSAHQCDDFQLLEPAWTPEWALLTRHDDKVVVRSIDKSEHDFIAAIWSGCSIGRSLEQILERWPEADLAAIVAASLSSGAFADAGIPSQ